MIRDSLREALRCVQTLLLPHPVPKELPSLDPRTIVQAVRDSRQFLGMDIVDDKDSHQTQEIPGIESIKLETDHPAFMSGNHWSRS